MSSADAPTSRDEQLAALLAAPPPRTVPGELQRAGYRQAASLGLMIFGLIFGGFGLAMGMVFFPWNFYRDWQLSAGSTLTAPGRVTNVGSTKLSINKRRVMSYDFTFRSAAGADEHGTCYTTGQQWSRNAAVTVRYLPADPTVCRIEGARLSEANGPAGLFMLVFPGMGAGLVAWSVISRRRIRNLLEQGTVGEAVVTAVEQTYTRVNKQYVFKITLQRTDAPDAGALSLRSYQPAAISFARDRMASKQPVFVLYDPANPKRVLLPETL